MSDRKLEQWTAQAFKEIRELEQKEHRIQSRCCRAALNGAVELRTVDDPLLMNEYTPRLRYCPECGRQLDM